MIRVCFPLHQTPLRGLASHTEDKSQHTDSQLTQISLQPFSNETLNTYKGKYQTKKSYSCKLSKHSHPRNIPPLLRSFLLSPTSGVIRPRGNHRNFQRQHTLPREWASTLCLKGLQSIIPTRYGHQVKGQKPRGCGQVSSCTGQFPFCLFSTSTSKLGTCTKGQGQFSQPANS